MVLMTLMTIVTSAYKSTYNVWGPHIVLLDYRDYRTSTAASWHIGCKSSEDKDVANSSGKRLQPWTTTGSLFRKEKVFGERIAPYCN